MRVADLIAQWRDDANLLEKYGDTGMANVCRAHADCLVAALQTEGGEILNLAEASIESGYSVDRLRHMVAAGEIPNAGRKGSPGIRRGDLPQKLRRKTGSAFNAARAASEMLRREKP